MKRLLPVIALLAVLAPWTRANQAAHGFCEVGAQVVVTSGLTSNTQVQASFPACTVTVFNHGGGIALIYSDSNNTVLANPFTATTNGQWTFYAANGRYDIQMSGAGFPTPVTISDVFLNDAANQAPAIACSNVTYAATLAFNVTNNACYTVILTGALTVTTIGSPTNGNILKLQLYQNAAGGNNVTFPGNFNLPTGFSFQTGSNAHNDLTWIYDAPNSVWQPLSTLPSTATGSSPGGANHQVQCNVSSTFGACTNNPVIMYVSSTGNDSNDGKTWDTAKLTIAGACTALPSGNSSCSAGAGLIYASSTGYVLPSGTVPPITLRILDQLGEEDSGPTARGIDCRTYGCRALFTPGTMTVTTNGTSTVTTTGVSDFIVGDDLVIPQAGSATSQTTPGAPTVQTVAANGSITVSYECVGVDSQWGLTAAGASASTTTAPTVFGLTSVTISSATWVANVVTVNTSTAMPFSSGTFHVMVSDLTSGGTQIGNIRLATIVSGTQLTYSLTGSGSVTVNSDSYVTFVNGFVLTTVASVQGSSNIVLTTDINHNLQQQLASNHPTKIFLDGINFAGEAQPAFANGEFTILSTTANTITVSTPYTATISQNAAPSSTFSTAHIAEMTVLTWAEILVTCPSNVNGTPSTGGAYYAVYANYGSGFAPIGFTPYFHSIFIDYGPAYNQSGFLPPTAMNLPATPPGAAQRQPFEGKITAISGTTLTIDRSVPATVTSVTGYHSNGISLQNAVNASCMRFDAFANAAFYPVIIPSIVGGSYYFNAPIDIMNGTLHCNRASIQDGGNIVANGTITASRGALEWKRPEGGFTNFNNAQNGYVNWSGSGSPMLLLQTTSFVKGMNFTTTSTSQNGVVSDAALNEFEQDGFQSAGGVSFNTSTSMPLVIEGGQFEIRMRDIFFGGVPNPNWPLTGPANNQTQWWPVPAIEEISGPSNPPQIIWEGLNYGNGTGFQLDSTYPGSAIPVNFIEISNVLTYQQAWQPFVQIVGNAQLAILQLTNVTVDTIPQALVGSVNCSSCGVLKLQNAGGAGVTISGSPFTSSFGVVPLLTALAPQNTSAVTIGGGGFTSTLPIVAKNGIITTANPYDNFNRANGAVGSNWTPILGSFNVTGNQVQANVANDNTVYWNALGLAVSDAPQFSQATMSVLSNRSGPAIFLSPLNLGGLGGFGCYETTTTLSMTTISNGVPNVSIASTSITGNNGDVVRIEGFPTGTNNTNLTCYLNGVSTLTGSFAQAGTGFPGLDLFNTTVRADNWSGGFLQPIAQLEAEQDWPQPQHFEGPVTVGTIAPIAGTLTTGIYANTYNTPTNCNVNGASPAACGSAVAGVVVVPTTTTTYTVNSTSVTTNSRIFIMPITDATGVSGSPTCNAPPTPFIGYVSGRTAGTSFTFTLPSTAGTSCWIYWIVD